MKIMRNSRALVACGIFGSVLTAAGGAGAQTAKWMRDSSLPGMTGPGCALAIAVGPANTPVVLGCDTNGNGDHSIWYVNATPNGRPRHPKGRGQGIQRGSASSGSDRWPPALDPANLTRIGDERIFELVPSGVDETLISENLKLTPTERLEKMVRVLEFVENVRAANSDKLSSSR
jgi:hypothetical protein